jgi:hypothetical protein
LSTGKIKEILTVQSKDATEIRMKVQDLIHQIRDFFHREPELSDVMVAQLIRSLANSDEDELSCNEVYDLLDQYAESHLRGEDAEKLMPLLKEHLDVCHECCDEYDALLSAVEGSKDE